VALVDLALESAQDVIEGQAAFARWTHAAAHATKLALEGWAALCMSKTEVATTCR